MIESGKSTQWEIKDEFVRERGEHREEIPKKQNDDSMS
jgi:hypothetical protein